MRRMLDLLIGADGAPFGKDDNATGRYINSLGHNVHSDMPYFVIHNV